MSKFFKSFLPRLEKGFIILISLLVLIGCSNNAAKTNATAALNLSAKIDPNTFLKLLKDDTAPKDIGENKIVPLDSILTATTVCGSPLPKTLGELNQIDKSSSIVTKKVGIDLSLFGISGGLNKKDVLIISNFITYRDYDCSAGRKRVSVGMQIYIHATSKSYKVSTADIPKLAAAVELGYASADYHIHIFGLTNANDIYKNLPGTNFDVASYSKVVSSFDGIVSSLSNKMEIDPIVTNIQ